MPKILVSGAGFGNSLALPFCAPDVFFEKLLGCDVSEALADFVWCYRAPWGQVGIAGSDAEQSLSDWLTAQRKVLNARQNTAAKISFVNLDRVDLADCLAMLGAETSIDAGQVPVSAAAEGFSTALAKLFEWSAPEYWDVFEALESIAWNPSGEPLYRHTLPYPPEGELPRMLRCLQNGFVLPSEIERHSAFRQSAESAAKLAADRALLLEQQLSKTQIEVDALKTRLDERAQKEKDALSENELLLLQLHQVQEELESIFLDKNEQDQQFKRREEALVLECDLKVKALADAQAELKKITEALKAGELQQAKLQKDLDDRAKLLGKSEGEAKELLAENELLLLQLHQVQEELESIFLDKNEKEQQFKLREEALVLERDLKVKALADAQAELKKTAEALKAGEVRQAKLQKDLDDRAKLLGKSESEAKELLAENELLLLQLHQVQEELEHYYLAYQALEAKVNPPSKSVTVVRPEGAVGPKSSPLQFLARPFNALTKMRRKQKSLRRHLALVKASGMFDEHWYLEANPDVKAKGMSALRHYLLHGWTEGRDPCAGFNNNYYLRSYPDVMAEGMNPLVHYLQYGQHEHRKTKPY